MIDTKHKPAFGVIFHPTFAPESLAGFARRAEAAGFEELWLWGDCFLPGAFTSAAVALSATQNLRVGIGLLPAKAFNALFAAMEITTLARAFPGRFMPGFGHGVDTWMAQIGASPKPSLRTLADTIIAVRRLLNGDCVTVHSEQVNLDRVQMQTTPRLIPPIFVGGMRVRTLQMAGRVGDGTILTGMSSPGYIRWAREQVQVGMAESGRTQHRVVVYLDVKVNPDGESARAATRRALARRLPWVDAQMAAAGIAEEVYEVIRVYGTEDFAGQFLDAWLDLLSAAGTPEQVAGLLQQWVDSSVDSIIFQPLNGDPDCLDEYTRYLMPALKDGGI